MTQPSRVTVQLRRPSGDDPGQITEGFYTVTDGILIMTHPDGKPVDSELYRQTLKPGDQAEAIARVLAKDVRRALLGVTETEESFRRPLHYPALSVA